jgi:hypothetical protein
MKDERITTDELAAKLDQFGYDFDPYGYVDDVSSREEGFLQIRSELLKGNTDGYRNYLQEVAEEEGEFADEAKNLVSMLDRYQEQRHLLPQEKQSVLDRIDEIARNKPPVEKGRIQPVKEAVR